MRQLTICLVGLLIAISSVALARTWTDSTGKYRVEAEFVEFTDGNVKLKKTDGNIVSVPASKLSKADQQWVRDELKRRRSSPSRPSNNTPVVAASGDWPQWRGPNRDGISPETGLLDSWPSDGPPLLRSARGAGKGYSSVAVSDGRIYAMGNRGGAEELIAFDEKTGDLLWSTRVGNGRDCNCTPTVSGGVKQYVTLVGRGVISVAAEDGKPLWHYERVANGTANVPTPIVKDDYVFCSSGYDEGGSALLKIEKQGTRVAVREVYYRRNNELQNHHGGMILIGDHIYMGHGHNNGFPVCINMLTGQPAWGPLRGPGRDSAAIAAADGHLYFRYQDGTMALIEATPARYNLKGQFRIASVNGQSWPHPAIANGKLYLRDQDELHCYDIRRQ